MVHFVMVMSKEGGSDSSSDDIKELKAGLKALLEVVAGKKERKALKTKNEYLQSQVDKLKTVAVAKGWKLNGPAN